MRDYLVNVLINIPIFEEFSYKIPKFIDKNDIKKGSRVLVPFRNKNVVGVVIGFSVDDKKSKIEFEIEFQSRKEFHTYILSALMYSLHNYS